MNGEELFRFKPIVTLSARLPSLCDMLHVIFDEVISQLKQNILKFFSIYLTYFTISLETQYIVKSKTLVLNRAPMDPQRVRGEGL